MNAGMQQFNLPRLALIMLVAGALATTGYRLFNFWQSVSVQPTQRVVTTAPQETSQPSASDYSVLLSQAYLFGHFDQSTEPDVAPESTLAPVTQLNLILNAVFYQDSGQSMALISEGRQPAGLYSINDDIQPGVKVVSIEPEAVTIKRSGQLEKVVFSEFARNSSRPGTKLASAPPVRRPIQQEPPVRRITN